MAQSNLSATVNNPNDEDIVLSQEAIAAADAFFSERYIPYDILVPARRTKARPIARKPRCPTCGR